MSRVIPIVVGNKSVYPDGEGMLYGNSMKMLEYIQTDGTQCIDTNFKGDQDTTISVTVSVQKHGCVFAGGSGWRQSETGLWVNQFNNMAEYGSVNKATPNDPKGVHTYMWQKDCFWADGSLRWSAGERTFKCATSFTISSTNRADGRGEFASLTIYGCKIYDNGLLVRDMVPALHHEYGAGMWDRIENKFYGNAGDGEIIPGKEVEFVGS